MSKIISARLILGGPAFNDFGRGAWALIGFVKGGLRGCTPLDTPGARWSGYAHKLIIRRGLDIATVRELHWEAFPGKHARDVLHSVLEILSRSDASENAAA